MPFEIRTDSNDDSDLDNDSETDPENDSTADSDTSYCDETTEESSSRRIGDYTWSALNNKVHVMLIENPEKEKHLIPICVLVQNQFQVVILGASADLSWLPSNCVFWEAEA